MNSPSVPHCAFVALLGRPNAGKSTLLNSLLAQKISIVSPKAQTTRDQILGVHTLGETQLIFLDTPGIHKAKEGGINQFMLREVERSLEGADIALILLDIEAGLRREGDVLNTIESKRAQYGKKKIIFCVGKWDLKKTREQWERQRPEWETLLGRFDTTPEILFINSRSEKDAQRLLSVLTKSAPEAPHHFMDAEQVSDRSVRFLVAEKVREALFSCLGDEIPYSCAVRVLKYDESPKMDRIECEILVERDSQKGMVIGAGAKKIKEIGSQAREAIEQFLDKKVFLDLTVRVLKDWSKDKEKLKWLGYQL